MIRFQTSLLAFILAIPILAFGQSKRYYDFFQQEYFFGNVPSARTEAMAKTDVAIGGSVSSSFFNPAGTALIENGAAQLSYSKPFYALTKSRYLYFGYVQKFNKLTIGLTHHRYDARASGWTIDVAGVDFPVQNPVTSNTALNLVYQPIENLYVGMNFNMYWWKIFESVKTARASHLDAGLIYVVPLDQSQSRLQFGASVSNFTTSTITYESPLGSSSTSPFPVVSRGGISWISKTKMKVPGVGETPVDLTASAQYQALLNNDYRNGINVGLEAVLNNAFAFRLGYLQQKLNDHGVATNLSEISDITYGFGVIIPCKGNEINLDYTALKAPDHTSRGRRLPNFHTFTVQYILNKSKKA